MLRVRTSWASEASPHTSESQLRSDMYICLYMSKVQRSMRVNACPFPAAMFKRQH